MKTKALVIGAGGQLGTELTAALRTGLGTDNVIATDINPTSNIAAEGPFQVLDVMDSKALGQIVQANQITHIYHLAAILSAVGEQKPLNAWDLNMQSLLHVLELAREKKLAGIYWPSSIAVFGTSTPGTNTPQDTVMAPNTVYGISKISGELWASYYHEKYGVDVRSLRYPGLIGYKALPGGGTTDYAVDIYHKALQGQEYTCFLRRDSRLPMMYMSDAVKATIDLMEAPAQNITVRTSYNLAAMSFTPEEMAQSIRTHIPDFKITYQPDFRQEIADSWPDSVDDSVARKDWGWQPAYGLNDMTGDMLHHLAPMYKPEAATL